MKSYAFFLQYISLMLIVICLVVATDTREKVQLAPQKVAVVIQEKPELYSLTKRSFTDLFHEDSAELVSERYAVLETLLRSHDLTAEIEILTQQQAFALALSRSVTLRRALRRAGIPSDAVHVRAQLRHEPDENNPEKITVDFQREAS